jgi:FAD/FMN-containing dehydrogenase/Fe-S oxidoreductase
LDERAELRELLRSRLKGEVHFDPYTKSLYATDASNHSITPLGVVLPRHEEDLQAVVEIAAELDVALLPRGAGTSLAGSAIGEALILDCSQHLTEIHHIDPEARVAEVGPGVVCNQLNEALSAYGLQYGPDPASADRATFGGMIGTNATGAHSIRYGMTSDHVVATEVLLADGSTARFGDHSLQEAERKAASNSMEGAIYRQLIETRVNYHESVREHWPRTWRRSSGYSLNYLTGFTPDRPAAWYDEPGPYPPAGEFNLAPLMCGSEGTLAVIRRALVRLVPKPKWTALLVVGFESVAAACDATPAILETHPAAVELIPRLLIERARAVPMYSRKLGFVDGDPAALLVVEYSGETQEHAGSRAAQLDLGGRVLSAPSQQADLWTVRKAGLGLLLSVPGDEKPITFMEDVSVPVARLGQYVREVDALLEQHGTHGEWYAHASAGCLHMRPLINLKTEGGVQQMREIADAVVDLVVEMKGSISGEHGDGVSHTSYNERLFGRDLTTAFREVKRAFDPDGILNPGKVVVVGDGEGEAAPIDANLRYGPAYQAQAPPTFFAFSREGGFDRAIEACTGVGICRQTHGVMCPSFQATRLEKHSTRGRANALRSAISGFLPQEALTSPELYDILDLCLECKGCKSECPTEVDMARLKSEFLGRYQAEHGIPLRSRLFGEISRVLRALRPLAILINQLARTRIFRWGAEKAAGIAQQRVLPALSPNRFARKTYGPQDGERVVLFLDTFTEFQVPEIGEAAVKLLAATGFRVEVASQQVCCGRPLISKGLLDRARQNAERNVQALAQYATQGIPIVGLEPSCLSALRDEYLELLPGDPDAIAVAEAARLIEELLAEPLRAGGKRIDGLAFDHDSPIMLHNHCHTKSLIGSEPLLEMLRATGAFVEEIESGCCGMAGSFGYEREHYGLSMQIGELVLFPAIRERPARARVAAPGVSCRVQIYDGTGKIAEHPIQIMADALRSE